MSYTLSILATALTVLISISGNAFAGATPMAVPEPATLTFSRHRFWWGRRGQIFQTEITARHDQISLKEEQNG